MKRLVKPERQLSKKWQRVQHQKHRRRSPRLPHFIIKGTTVEVSTKEEGFHGAWFTATVLKDRKRSTDKVYVEYKTLLRGDDDEDEDDPTNPPLREYVKPYLIRPVPPVEDHQCETFHVGDAVDAFHLDGWWTGTVTQVKKEDPPKFVIFFEKPPHHIEFDISDLRLHRDWVIGAWVPPVNLEATMPAKNAEKEESALISPRNTGENKVQVKKVQDSTEGKEGNEAENAPGDCLTGDTNLHVILGLACDNRKIPGSKRSYRPNGSTAKRGRSWSNFDGNKLHAVKVTNGLEDVVVSEKRKRARPCKSVPQASIPSMDDASVAASLEASTFGQVLSTNGSSGVGLSNDKMKENQLGNIKNAMSPSSTGGGNSVEALKKPPSSTGGDSAEEASRKPCEKVPTKRGKKRTTNLNVISVAHDVTSPKSVEGNTAGETDMNKEVSDEESPNDASDNQPLAKWLGNLHSPTRVDSSRSSLIRCNAEVASEHMEVIEEGSAAVATAAISEHMGVVEEGTATAAATVDEIVRPIGLELSANLPFEKQSMLWPVLESMEIFQKLPQKPHFQPLLLVKETVREGLAIGSMVTFTCVVGKTSKLRCDDTMESIDAILETLLELEAHGFDVGAIRERVIRLGQTKEKQEKLEEELEKLNREITEHVAEKSKIDKEIEKINMQINELQEKQSGIIVMKERKTGEIEELQMKLKCIEEGISSIRSVFEVHGSWP